MYECNPARTPLDPNQRLDKSMAPKTPDEVKDMEKVPYREALGSVMFLCQGTRPDIAHAITSLSAYSENPGKAHWASVKRLFRYLKGTRNYTLIYSHDVDPTLQGFCDADWLQRPRQTINYGLSLYATKRSGNMEQQEAGVHRIVFHGSGVYVNLRGLSRSHLASTINQRNYSRTYRERNHN